MSTCSCAQEFHLTLQAMKEAVEGATRQATLAPPCQPGVTSALVSQLAWLLGTAAGLAQKTLSKADVAAVFLSRKILLDRISLEGAGAADLPSCENKPRADGCWPASQPHSWRGRFEPAA